MSHQVTIYNHLGEEEPPPIADKTRGKMDIHFSSASGVWGTPDWLYKKLDDEFAFALDAAADKQNHRHPVFWLDKDVNALAVSWDFGGPVFLNPPYGRGIDKWTRKAREEADKGLTVVCLLPARVDTNWFFESCFGQEIRLVRGRLHFLVNGERTDAAPFPSMVVVMGPGAKTGQFRVIDARGKK